LGFRLASWPGVLAGLAGLSLPGAFLVVAAFKFFNLGNPRVASFFKGMSIGSMVLVAVLCAKIGGGLLTQGLPLRRDLRAMARVALAAAVATAYWMGLPIQWLLLFGAASGLALELAL
jgi:chromate transport protein ChrA